MWGGSPGGEAVDRGPDASGSVSLENKTATEFVLMSAEGFCFLFVCFKILFIYLFEIERD